MANSRFGTTRTNRRGTSPREIGPRDYVPPARADISPPATSAMVTLGGVAIVASILALVAGPYINPTPPPRSERPDEYPETSIHLSLNRDKSKSEVLVENHNFFGAKPEDIRKSWVWYSGIEGTNTFNGRGVIPQNISRKVRDITDEIMNDGSSKLGIRADIRLIMGKEQRGFRLSPEGYAFSDETRTILGKGPLSEEGHCQFYALTQAIEENLRDISER